MARDFMCTKTEPVVQTKAGKLRGFRIDGVYAFHGVKYADAKRFQQPEPVQPWEGIKNALAYGYVCPMLKQDEPNNELMVPHRYWPLDENCQYLNIWTKSLDPSAKKPVLVWLHGGGFAAGSSIEHIAYEGENMSRYGDVVVVSLNHRLNILGYLDLSPFGEKYANSGNAGSADMVAALQWIHDNIAGFGGDPDNVTLFGQSGGGMKVWTLMQTPAADGLFHKGIVQSGCIDGVLDLSKSDGTAIVTALMQALGVDNVEALETIPYAQLAEAYNRVMPEVAKTGAYVGGNPMPNDWYLGDPCVIGFTEHAKTIPVMVGTVLGEFAFMPALSEAEKADKAGIAARLRKMYGDDAEKLQALFAEAYPDKDPSDLLFLDSLFRAPSIEFLHKKAQHPESGTYSYMFSYTFPYDGGHLPWHCSEIPFVFHNTSLVAAFNEEGVTDLLEKQMCDAWLNFARTGKPSSDALPAWPACTPDDEATMIFDRTCTVRHNYDHALIALHKKARPAFPFGGGDEEQKIQH
ncbi:MAG: carboxylesterase/lipase family protein [Acutalibacteraceae bacterium]|jgi:para-nitrobenzyl esterase